MITELPLTTAWLEKEDGQMLPLTGNLSIGRTAGNQLVVEDQRVSRRHAIIHFQGGEFWLVDLGSRNGTCVGDRRIYQPVRLRDRDRIRICSFSVTFRQPGTERSVETLTQSAMHTRAEITAVQCWLLVADIEGSTALAHSMPPDELAVILGHWFEACRQLIEQNQGAINKYLGDGFLAFWREKTLRREGLTKAILSIRALQQKASPRFRFVVHCGEVLFNSAILSSEENLSGASLNFVFRMEKLAPALGQNCLLSQPAADALRGLLDVAPVGEHSLSGFTGKFPLFTLPPPPAKT